MLPLPKTGRVVLEGEAYRALCRLVFARDQWKCRRCERRSNLQAHHLRKRSDVRIDLPYNLITLCGDCHQLVEDGIIVILGDDAGQILRFRRP